MDNQAATHSFTWDYFLSHASEDKALVAEPLAYVLRESSFKVWYDNFSLKVATLF